MNLEERDLIINKGTWAEGLMKQDNYKDCINQLLEEKFAMFTMTESKGTDEREALYWLLRGIQEFERCLEGYVQNKNYLLKEENNNE
jgi:hypothetical protein